MSHLTDVRYKIAGLTAIYVPRAAIHIPFSVAIRDKRFIKQIEGKIGKIEGKAVFYW